MIDATASLRAAEQISATTLIEYLRANGWSSRPSRVDGIAIFSKRIPGADNPVQFILPIESAFDEEQRRVADALRTIAQIEGISEDQIAERVQQLARASSSVSEDELSSSASGRSKAEGAGSSERKKAFQIFLSGSRSDSITDKEIESVAQLVRKSLGLSDQNAFNIVELLENEMPKAINHFRLEVVTTNDAQEIYSTKTPPRIFAKESIYRLAREGDTRSRFLFAHEIGHLLLHSRSVHFSAPNGPKLNKLHKTIEAQASKFALFFLIPNSIVRQFRSVESLSLHCQVRREVAELRMKYLIADEEGANVERKIQELFTQTVRDLKRNQISS
ncbi:ImmA/IrrE family metallo-endopeptidase [Bradyrhizobium sp.]